MKQKFSFYFLLAVLMTMSVRAFAVNKISGTATIKNANYTVTSATPFADDAIANLTTDVATLILTKIKPSAAIGMLADHVRINGEVAKNGENCQVKMYSQGCIILPYGDDCKPLTVYSEPDFGGDDCNDFGLENSGGFMNTLTDEKLNNRIRSFKLKRGYMVTFSIRPGGYGYSRCFIAADKDLEVAELPAILDNKISSYRVFKWYDTSKKGLADAANAKAACDALNVTTTYEWWSGKDENLMPDIECVPHHYKEEWPTPSMLGSSTTSAHMKTNNEPRNPEDEPKNNPESLDLILSNWEQLMRTGQRLCSPSSWDGSDYWNGTGFLKEFFDSIDARGWRCDIIDLHGYWLLTNFQTNIPNWYNAVKRPVWVSEWCWGASWGNNGKGTGAFVSGVTEAQNRDNVRSICEYMNGLDYVERYYFWNGEREPSKMRKDNGTLTDAGNYYAAMDPGLAYSGNYDFIPTTPPQKAPSGLTTITAAGKKNLRWYDSNGELNQSMVIEYRASSSDSWQEVAVVEQKENPSNYTVEASMGAGQYRIHLVDFNGANRYSNVISVEESSAYYLFNVGAQQWLCTGNAWGSHASLTPNGGVDVLTNETTDGNYIIDTQLVNGDKHYLNILDNGPWMDQTAGRWTFEETDDGTYLLTCNGKNLAYDGSTSSLIASDATDVNAQWLFLTRADRMEQLSRATQEHPVDASFLIVDNDFARYNSLRRDMWQGGPAVGGHFDVTTSNQCAEKFNCQFDVFQTISGAPAGNYRLQVQGFYRNGGYKDAATKHNGGTESLDALLYVNEETKPLPSIFTEAGNLPNVGITTSGINGKFPDSMDDAALFFADGLYENTLEFSLAEGEDLRIGIKKTATTINDWTIFDNFRLIYLGLPPVPNDLTNDRRVDAADVRALVSHLLGNTPENFNIDAANINGDKEVNISDVTALIEIILRLQNSLPASSDQTTGEASSNQAME